MELDFEIAVDQQTKAHDRTFAQYLLNCGFCGQSQKMGKIAHVSVRDIQTIDFVKIIELNSVSLFLQEQHAPILVFYSYFEYRNSLDIHLYRLV